MPTQSWATRLLPLEKRAARMLAPHLIITPRGKVHLIAGNGAGGLPFTAELRNRIRIMSRELKAYGAEPYVRLRLTDAQEWELVLTQRRRLPNSRRTERVPASGLLVFTTTAA